jgi:hypothetical protein
MDPIYGEFAKGGVVALSFGIMLIFILRSHMQMGKELKEDKEKVLNAFVQNTEFVRGLTEALNRRPCVRGEIRDGRVLDGKTGVAGH